MRISWWYYHMNKSNNCVNLQYAHTFFRADTFIVLAKNNQRKRKEEAVNHCCFTQNFYQFLVSQCIKFCTLILINDFFSKGIYHNNNPFFWKIVMLLTVFENLEINLNVARFARKNETFLGVFKQCVFKANDICNFSTICTVSFRIP